MKIVVDAFGGDNAPVEIVEGCVLALKKHKDLKIVLCGSISKIREILDGREDRIEIVSADDVISNDDSPTEAIRKKTDSSLVRAFDTLKNNDDVCALISAGSTGAILTGAIMKIGRIKGISRPTLAPVVPTKIMGKNVILADSGANVDCKAINLAHFALMGSTYYSILFGEKKPKVALLNIGVEEHKGNELTKEANEILKTMPINYVGNMEAREFMSGDYDVVVADGFNGNVLLKSTEGAVMGLLSMLKKSIKSHFCSKIGAIFMRKTFKEIKQTMNLSAHGGSPFLGIKKLVIKNHGSSGRENIAASIDQAITLHKNKLISKIEALLPKQEVSDAE